MNAEIEMSKKAGHSQFGSKDVVKFNETFICGQIQKIEKISTADVLQQKLTHYFHFRQTDETVEDKR